MSEAKHTPGPWHHNRKVFTRAGSVAVLPPESVSEFPIAYAPFGFGSQPDLDTAIYNAVLIAAAPELLARCEEVVAFLRAFLDGPSIKLSDAAALFNRTQETIAKAQPEVAPGA